MRTMKAWALAACVALSFSASKAVAQEVIVVEEETVVLPATNNCKTHYYSGRTDNWFIQIGAGINSPFMENSLPDGSQKHHITATYNIGFGKWFSPYIGWRLGFSGTSLHWDYNQFNSANMINANFDLMWDMFNTCHGVNSSRVFSLVPFVGFGGAFIWDYSPEASMVLRDNGKVKRNSWALPLSAGLQVRLRMCRYADFFLEGRAQFAGDNMNNQAVGAPVDINLSAMGGFTFYIGNVGPKVVLDDGDVHFNSYNPCEYSNYILSLNDQVNTLRANLDMAKAALDECEANLNTPRETIVEKIVVNNNAELLSTVRFTINSSKISAEEMVNVYNMAQYLKQNPDVNINVIGYADKDTGTGEYNMALSERRAKAVCDALVNEYGINRNRLTPMGEGSASQLYGVNNWNRIVVFKVK